MTGLSNHNTYFQLGLSQLKRVEQVYSRSSKTKTVSKLMNATQVIASKRGFYSASFRKDILKNNVVLPQVRDAYAAYHFLTLLKNIKLETRS
jgi:hypothetical protein